MPTNTLTQSPAMPLSTGPGLEVDEERLADHIANDFTRRFPRFAAYSGISRWQVVAMAISLGIALGALAVAPRIAFLILVISTTIVTGTSTVVGVAGMVRHRRGAAASPELDDTDLPPYTVLVPAYHEEEVIGDLVRCMHALNYPADMLEVLILVERRDLPTKKAIAEAQPAPFIRVVELPAGLPQTKPRSCNAGLLAATGDLLVIYDAEDRPEPDQLRKAAARFHASADDVACLQATLLVNNADRNFITRQFALEYAVRYTLTLPGMAALGLPIPLGGTSNHFRTEALRRLGGWDAWNVTEDADLGMRCQAMGYRVGVLDSVTWGESTTTAPTWLRQRTRWLKGFLVTALVHTRNPVTALREFHLGGLVTVVILLAGTPLHYLAQSMALLVWASHTGGLSGAELPHTSLTAGLLGLAGLLASLSLQLIAARRRVSGRSIAVFTPFLPAYWVLQWAAAWRALVQLVRAPFQWEKTPHGATTQQ